MSGGYEVRYGSPAVQRETEKLLKRLARDMQQRIYDAMKGLGADPHPQQSKHLSAAVAVYGYAARYRLRVGDYRVLYDVDDTARRVVVLAVRRRSEKTYH